MVFLFVWKIKTVYSLFITKFDNSENINAVLLLTKLSTDIFKVSNVINKIFYDSAIELRAFFME